MRQYRTLQRSFCSQYLRTTRSIVIVYEAIDMDSHVHFRTETVRISLSMITQTTILTQLTHHYGLYDTGTVLDLKMVQVTRDQCRHGKSIEIICKPIRHIMSSLHYISFCLYVSSVCGTSVNSI